MHEIFKKYMADHIVLSDEQWAFVLKFFKARQTKRNEILLEKGEICQHLYFVIKGCLRVFLIDDQANEATRFLIFEGRFGTAFPSFTLRRPSAAAIRSIEASEVLMVTYKDYQTILDEVPGWERMVRIGLQMDYIDAIMRIESLISMDARQRYNILLKKQPKLVQRLPNKILADYLGISQETLSRLKSQKTEKPKG